MKKSTLLTELKGKKIRVGNKYKVSYGEFTRLFILTTVEKGELLQRQIRMAVFGITNFGLHRCSDPILISDSEHITIAELQQLFDNMWNTSIENYEGKILV